jgi:hypothetical protein
MDEYQGKVKAKFIGKPNGKFMKGAPGNYIHGQIYEVSFRQTKFPFWELLDPPPVLKVPDAQVEDSVFEGDVFVPEQLELDEPEPINMGVMNTNTPISTQVDGTGMMIGEKEEELIPSGQPSSESSASPTVPPADFVTNDGVVEKPFKDVEVKPEDDMPAEFLSEMRTMGDEVLGEHGVEKIERKKTKKQHQDTADNS